MGPLEPPPLPDRATNLSAVFADLTDSQLEERLAGFEKMLAQLPDDDDVMRPAVVTVRDAVEVELMVREHIRRRQ